VEKERKARHFQRSKMEKVETDFEASKKGKQEQRIRPHNVSGRTASSSNILDTFGVRCYAYSGVA
jgi:hypothetical protein